jgi:hypothetical protein
MSERWTIQGVDRALREQVASAAKTAGLSLGEWVATALQTALSGSDRSASDVALAALAMELGELRSRVDRLESGAAVPAPPPPPAAVVPPPAPPVPAAVAPPAVTAAAKPVAIHPPLPPLLIAETAPVAAAAADEAPPAETPAKPLSAGRLSEATRQRICDLAGRSYSVLQIAKKTGVRVNVVEKVLRSMGRENLQVKIL